MPAHIVFEYAIVRVVPRVERGEFINVGVIVFCRPRRYLKARIELDLERLLTLDPAVDEDGVRRRLHTIVAVCRGGTGGGPIGQLPLAERFHWLVAPSSTIVQPSPVHTGLSIDLDATLEHLVNVLVAMPRPGASVEC